MPAMKDSKDQVKPGRDLDPVIEVYKRHVDVTLIREDLRLTVDQRFQLEVIAELEQIRDET